MGINCMEDGTNVELPTGETGKVYYTRRERRLVDNDNNTVVTVVKDNTHAVMVPYSQLTRVVDEPPGLSLEDRVENLELIVQRLLIE